MRGSAADSRRRVMARMAGGNWDGYWVFFFFFFFFWPPVLDLIMGKLCTQFLILHNLQLINIYVLLLSNCLCNRITLQFKLRMRMLDWYYIMRGWYYDDIATSVPILVQYGFLLQSQDQVTCLTSQCNFLTRIGFMVITHGIRRVVIHLFGIRFFESPRHIPITNRTDSCNYTR